jgi:predicted nucleotidyltransferase
VALLREQEEELRRLGVLSLSLFGSVARNEASAKSDVDLLVTFREPITSDSFFATKFFLEDLLGCGVDLITESALRDRVRRIIEPDLVRVA